MKLLRDLVLVRRTKESDKSAGGILIPESAQTKPFEGTVVYAGPGKVADNGSLIPTTVKPGDHVLFEKWTGVTIKVKNEDLVVLTESNIIGIID